MKLIKTKDTGTWFYFNGENEDDGAVCLRALSPTELKAINDKCTTSKVEYKRGERFVVTTVNEQKKEDMVYDLIIVDWKNIETETGVVECNAENKKTLMAEYLTFVTFVGKSLEQLTGDLENITNSQLKN